MSLLKDAQRVSRKVKKSNQQANVEIWISRIQAQILKIAAAGDTSYQFTKVPKRREYLFRNEQEFVAVAKHFSELGFKVDYEKEEGSRTVPAWGCGVMTISWE
jgi:xanthine/CO dehydrogenase XdhC/CoxF family maturation factor|tara:strand:+ start:232 stop:540 length:309 start_codon:yes stop_codon:yes gene_type:complete